MNNYHPTARDLDQWDQPSGHELAPTPHDVDVVVQRTHEALSTYDEPSSGQQSSLDEATIYRDIAAAKPLSGPEIKIFDVLNKIRVIGNNISAARIDKINNANTSIPVAEQTEAYAPNALPNLPSQSDYDLAV